MKKMILVFQTCRYSSTASEATEALTVLLASIAGIPFLLEELE